jgi:hypothetical protein
MKTKSIFSQAALYAAFAFMIIIGVLTLFPDGFTVKKSAATEQSQNAVSTDSCRVTAVYPWDGYSNRVLVRHRAQKRLYLNSYLAVEVRNIKLFDARVSRSKKPPILYFSDVAMRSLKPVCIDKDNGFVIYYLDQSDSSIRACDPYFTNMVSPWPINNITLGFADSAPLPTDAYGYSLFQIDRNAFWIMLCMIGFVISLFVLLIRNTSLLKAGPTGSQYSLAFTQIAFWTLIVLISYLYLWLGTQNYNSLTASALIIMGISAATTSGSRLISKRRYQSVLAARPKEGDGSALSENTYLRDSRGFFNDLFCDDNGSSISRWQMVLWTGVMGLVFLWVVVREKKMPEFSDYQLMLIGISSGAYLLLKPFEQINPPEETQESTDTAKPAKESPLKKKDTK